MEMAFRAFTCNLRLPDDPGPRRPGGYERGVTVHTVRKLCHQGYLKEAVEALGVLVQADGRLSRSIFYVVLRDCVVRKDLALGRRVHALCVQKGYESDTFLCNHILRIYASHGKLQDAMDVFTMVDKPDAFMWSSIISAHVKHGQDKRAIHLYHMMRRSSVKPDGHVFVAALQACARAADIDAGQELHADVLKSGAERDLFVCNCLVDMYSKCGSLENAQRVFDGLGQKNVVTWTALISGYSQHGMGQEALNLYRAMQDEGIVVPNSVTYMSLLQACATLGTPALEKGRQLHAEIRKGGHQADVIVGNSLVHMYAKCGSLEDARTVFEGLKQKDVVTWTSLISGYSQQHMGQEALGLFRTMQEDGTTVPNSVTIVCVLQACASVGTPALELGKQLHAQLREGGRETDVFVANGLVNMYAKCGSVIDARRVFDTLVLKDVATWNAMIAGYSQQGLGHEALGLYSAMQEEGIALPDSVTFVCLLQACASVGTPALETGKELHARISECGHQSDFLVASSLVNMYSRCGSLTDAQTVFETLRQKNVVTWTALIGGYSQHGMGDEALRLYSAMQSEGIAVPNSVTFVCLLQACASIGDQALETGKRLHAQIFEGGYQSDVFVANSLIDMYAKCGNVEHAQRVFDGLCQKDVVTWTALLGGYSQQGMGQQALRVYSVMEEQGLVVPDSVTFVCLLQACAGVGTPALEKGKQLHAQIIEGGYEVNVTVASSLVNMYAKCGDLEKAQRLFEGLAERDVVTWTTLIAGYSQQGMGQEALRLYRAMQEEGFAVPNSVTYVCLLQACAGVGTTALGTGKQLHTQIRDQGLQADVFIANSLVNMYAKCGSSEDAKTVFDTLSQKDVVTWTALIVGYSQQGMRQEALCLYSSMQEDGLIVPDPVMFVSLLQACAGLGNVALEKGKQLHVQIRERGLQADLFVANSLVDMYSKCGSLEDAQKVFDGLGRKDLVTWNSIISGYSHGGMELQALSLYSAMQEEGIVAPDCVTFTCLLQACASVGAPALQNGKHLHMQIVEQGHEADMFIASSLVNMYAKCGSVEDAQRVFDGLGEKDVVMWTTMIAGLSQHSMGHEALCLYSALQEEGRGVSDSLTLVSLLQACADVAALDIGRQLHAQIEEVGLQSDAFVAASLINMYGKCGSMIDAQQVFDGSIERDVVTWSALLTGYAFQGDFEGVFDLFERMKEDGIQPVGITFVSLLTVCSHAGLVNKGREYFDAMSRRYSIAPTVEHYTCMVDLLGRSGHLDEAQALISTMPVPPNAAVWHTLLGACRKWSNVELGRHAFDHAVKLDKEDAATYVLMSNIYSGAQLWDHAQELQEMRRRIGARKQPGQSWWTDLDGQIHSFVSGS